MQTKRLAIIVEKLFNQAKLARARQITPSAKLLSCSLTESEPRLEPTRLLPVDGFFDRPEPLDAHAFDGHNRDMWYVILCRVKVKVSNLGVTPELNRSKASLFFGRPTVKQSNTAAREWGYIQTTVREGYLHKWMNSSERQRCCLIWQLFYHRQLANHSNSMIQYHLYITQSQLWSGSCFSSRRVGHMIKLARSHNVYIGTFGYSRTHFVHVRQEDSLRQLCLHHFTQTRLPQMDLFSYIRCII